MTLCSQQVAVKSDGTNARAVSLPCRAWTCDDCNPKRHRRLVAEAIGGQPTKFLTLTSVRKEGVTPTQAAKQLAHAWRLLRLRIMRRYGWKRLPFLAVFEATELGWPHLHILMRCKYIEGDYISAVMEELTGAKIIKIEQIRKRRKCVNYCAKYCGKGTEKFGTCKRYWQSQDYDLRDEHEQPLVFEEAIRWEVSRGFIFDWCRMMERRRWLIYHENAEGACARRIGQ